MSPRILRPLIITGLVLLIPAIGVQTVEGWNWTGVDFLLAGIVIGTTALMIETAFAHARGSPHYKIAALIGGLAAFFLLWGNGAVGIIGEGDNLPRRLYVITPLIGFLGALLTWFKATGLANVCFTMAATVMVPPIFGLAIGASEMQETPGTAGIFALTICFAAVFFVCGLLFRRAGKQ